MKQYVIIGNSAAAIGAVEGIRSLDAKGNITIISDEPYHTYSRPLISYWLKGKVTEEKMWYREPDFCEKNRCTVKLGCKVMEIQPVSKIVVLESGIKIPYDVLLNATGSTPFVPHMEGLDQVEHKFTFLSYDDAKAVEKAMTPASRVLIVGAGLIGLKAAEALNGKAASITVIDLAERILPSILDETGAAIMQSHIEESGVAFHLGDSVVSFGVDVATLQSGIEVPYDIVILAVGVRPNVSLVADAGGKIGRGIQTDAHQQTSLPGVYAAGDCTESYDISSGEMRNLALLPNAYMQGEIAGICMAGGDAVYDHAIPMNAIGFFGLHIITAGSYDGEDFIRQNGKTYKRLFRKDGLLKGFILIGDVARAGIYTNLIKQQIPLSDTDEESLLERPSLLAMGRDYRREKLENPERA